MTRGVVGTTQWSHEGAWPGTPESVAMAREFVALHLEEHCLSELVDEARLVASELATNAVRHAGTPFAITIERRGGEVTISVRDWSSEYPVPPVPVMLATGGRGLMLVNALSVMWGVTVKAGGGKSVWARFRTGTL
jgi:anti-sigma regulatory factor (Ser/Thr protein kinase)